MTQLVAPKNVILYADDDQDDLMLIKDAFDKYSTLEVITVENGTEALSYLNSLSPLDPVPCLIILDINMPILNGKEVLKEIRLMERFKQTPVVLFSTSSQYHERKFAEDYNASFIPKPMDMEELEEVTGKFIDQCSAEVRNDLRKN